MVLRSPQINQPHPTQLAILSNLQALTERLDPAPSQSTEPAQAARLDKIRSIREFLEDEVNRYSATLRRYKRLDIGALILNTTATGSASGAVGTLVDGLTAPLIIALRAVSLFSVVTATAFTLAGKHLGKRVVEHQRKCTAAQTHLDVIAADVAEVLDDRAILVDEFAVILRQSDEYRKQKAELSALSRAEAEKSRKAKNELHEEVRAELNRLKSISK